MYVNHIAPSLGLFYIYLKTPLAFFSTDVILWAYTQRTEQDIMYCHVSAQIDQHLADVDRMDAREEAINEHAADILNEMLEGDSPIDEGVATFFEESGEIFEILKAAFVEDKECSSREDRKERLMRKLEDLWDKELVEMAEEEAEKRLD